MGLVKSASPKDVLKALFILMAKGKSDPFFEVSRERIHGAIYKLRDDYPILKIFIFLERRNGPYSSNLNQALTELQCEGVLNWLDHPGSKLFRVETGERNDLIIHPGEKFSTEELKKLGRAARGLSIRLGY